MRGHFPMLFVALLAEIPLFAQAQPPANSDQAAVVAFAGKAAVRALNFRQGDIGSLTRAHADFTPDGWKDFMKHMEGFLDEKGAPTFSSTFVPSGDVTFLGEKDRIVHFRIPGTLTQSNNFSKTTYRRAATEVYALRDLLIHDGKSIKIQHLEQITCVGASTACQ
jgi:hypothetical protein